MKRSLKKTRKRIAQLPLEPRSELMLLLGREPSDAEVVAFVRGSRKNPVRSEFNCDLYNAALDFAFPEKRQRRFWAQMLVQLVIESQKRFPASVFASTMTAMERAELKDLKCGALVKTVEKITRLANGEEWLLYGLQGYIDQAWPRGNAESLVLLLSKQDPQRAYSILQEIFFALYLPFLKKKLPKAELMHFVVAMNNQDSRERERYLYRFMEKGSIEEAKRRDSLPWLAHMAWMYADVMHYVVAGRFPGEALWKVREMEGALQEEKSPFSLADMIRSKVPRLELGPRRNPSMTFQQCVAKMSRRPGIYSPAGLCAKIGRQKYGAEQFARMSLAGRKKKQQ